jgi:phage terminase small subunit
VKLTPKQKAFADAYIETGNQTEAARRAGYSEKSAKQVGTENMTKPAVAAYIKERMDALEAQHVASADEVMRFFSSVMRGEVKDQFGLDPSLSDRLNAGKELMKRYAAVKDTANSNEAKIIIAADGGIEVDDGA